MNVTIDGNLLNGVATVITALGVVLNIWLTRKAGQKTDALAGKVGEQSINIQKIETATNSMQDALVKATGEAAHAAGLAEGKANPADNR